MKAFLLGAILFIVGLCLCVACAMSQDLAMNVQGVMATGGTASPACSPTYLFSENFDCSSGCATNCSGTDGLTNCTNTWTISGTVNFQATPIEGTYSVEVDQTSTAGYAYLGFTAQDNAYAHFIFSIDTLPAATKGIIYFTATSSAKVYVKLASNGKFLIYNGSATATVTDAISQGTAYHVWFGGTKGNGDGTAYVAFSTTSTKPACPGTACAQVTTGNGNAQVNRLYLGNDSTAHKLTFDHIGVSATDICSPTP